MSTQMFAFINQEFVLSMEACRNLLPSKAMKSFLERLAGGRCSFRNLGMGETAALSLSKGMRRGQVSPVNKSLKKQAREP